MSECEGINTDKKERKKVAIYVVSHKMFSLPVKTDLYIPLMVGEEYKILPSGYMSDQNGDSICYKNVRYNELTGLYWIWKNTGDEISGICHYRRFFTTCRGKLINLIFHKVGTLIDQNYIERSLQNYDVIVHNKTFFRQSNKLQLCRGMDKANEILILVEAAIREKIPEDLPLYQKIMNRKHAHLLNIIITRKALLDEYCAWLFPVLEEAESRVNKNFPGQVLPRVMGLIGERLLDVWLEKKKLRVKECFTVNTERIDWKLW